MLDPRFDIPARRLNRLIQLVLEELLVKLGVSGRADRQPGSKRAIDDAPAVEEIPRASPPAAVLARDWSSAAAGFSAAVIAP